MLPVDVLRILIAWQGIRDLELYEFSLSSKFQKRLVVIVTSWDVIHHYSSLVRLGSYAYIIMRMMTLIFVISFTYMGRW